MAARVLKHTHLYRVIAHNIDWRKALIGCKHCPTTEVWDESTNRIKVAERRYRKRTRQEFLDQFKDMEHLCCE